MVCGKDYIILREREHRVKHCGLCYIFLSLFAGFQITTEFVPKYAFMKNIMNSDNRYISATFIFPSNMAILCTLSYIHQLSKVFHSHDAGSSILNSKQFHLIQHLVQLYSNIK